MGLATPVFITEPAFIQDLALNRSFMVWLLCLMCKDLYQPFYSHFYITIMLHREHMVQPKLDRSDSVLFSRVRPAIQYHTDPVLTVWTGGAVSGYMYCRLLTAAAAAAATFVSGSQLTELVCIIALWCVSVSLY